jgi:hypothetical protein
MAWSGCCALSQWAATVSFACACPISFRRRKRRWS